MKRFLHKYIIALPGGIYALQLLAMLKHLQDKPNRMVGAGGKDQWIEPYGFQ